MVMLTLAQDGRYFSLANATDELKTTLYTNWQNGVTANYDSLSPDILALEDHEANAARNGSGIAAGPSATTSSAAAKRFIA